MHGKHVRASSLNSPHPSPHPSQTTAHVHRRGARERVPFQIFAGDIVVPKVETNSVHRVQLQLGSGGDLRPVQSSYHLQSSAVSDCQIVGIVDRLVDKRHRCSEREVKKGERIFQRIVRPVERTDTVRYPRLLEAGVVVPTHVVDRHGFRVLVVLAVHNGVRVVQIGHRLLKRVVLDSSDRKPFKTGDGLVYFLAVVGGGFRMMYD